MPAVSLKPSCNGPAVHNACATPHTLCMPAGEAALLGTVAKPFPLMEVIGDINGDGLGCTAWWAAPEEEGEEGGADAAMMMEQ